MYLKMNIISFPNVYDFAREEGNLKRYVAANKRTLFPKLNKEQKKIAKNEMIQKRLDKKKLFTKKDMAEQGKFASNLAIASGYYYRVTISDSTNPLKGGSHFFNNYQEGVAIFKKKGLKEFPPGSVKGKTIDSDYNKGPRKIIPDNIGFFLNKAGKPFEVEVPSKKEPFTKTRTFSIYPTTKDEEFVKTYYTTKKIKNSTIFGKLYNDPI